MPQPAFSGSQIQVSVPNGDTDPVYVRQHAQVAGLKDGGFIAVWQQYHTTNSIFDATSIQAQIYNADGSKRGNQFQVDAPILDTVDLDVSFPTVTVKADGVALVSWTQELHDGVNGNKAVIRDRSIEFGATGPSMSPVTDAAPEITAPHYRYEKADLVGGGVVYAYVKPHPAQPDTSVVIANVQIRDMGGLKDDTRVASIGLKGNVENATVVGLSNGNFAVVWQLNNPEAGDGSGSCIKARIFRLDKSKINDPMANPKIEIVPVTGEITVNTTTALHQNMPRVDALPNGGFAVAFQDVKGMHESDVRVATFDRNGGRTSDDFLVHTDTRGDQFNPDIAVLKDGRFVVSWQDGFTIRAQMFDPGRVVPDSEHDPDPDPDTLSGGAGNDTLDGTTVIGRIDGGDGFDTVSYANSGDFVVVFLHPGAAGFNQRDAAGDTYANIEAFIGTNFDDQIFGHTSDDRLYGGNGGDLIEGGQGNDLLVGGEGNDTLDGGAGADTLDGGAGNNTLLNVDSADTVINPQGGGIQKIEVRGSYALSGAVQVEVLQAGATAGTVSLTGNNNENTIIGNATKNTLKGQGGNDKLYGGGGKDLMSGGSGKDVFAFDTKVGKGNLDTISDFKPKDDSIWLDNKVFTRLGNAGSATKPAKLNKDFFIVGDKAEDANDYLIYDKVTGRLSYDADGSGSRAAVEIAILKKGLDLTYKDFFVI